MLLISFNMISFLPLWRPTTLSLQPQPQNSDLYLTESVYLNIDTWAETQLHREESFIGAGKQCYGAG